MILRKRCFFKFHAVNPGVVINTHGAMASLAGANAQPHGSGLLDTIALKIATARGAIVSLGNGFGGRGYRLFWCFQTPGCRNSMSIHEVVKFLKINGFCYVFSSWLRPYSFT